MEHVTAYPLCWPAGWSRPKKTVQSRFGKWDKPITISLATYFTLEQLRMMGKKRDQVIISSDLKLRNDGLPYSTQRDPEDKGVSVWWMDGDEQKVIALAPYNRIADNLYAIGKTLEAMRGISRWGGAEILTRTFSGFAALEHLPDEKPWWEVLGCEENDPEETVVFRYKKVRSFCHPNNGGTVEEFDEINKAFKKYKELKNV